MSLLKPGKRDPSLPPQDDKAGLVGFVAIDLFWQHQNASFAGNISDKKSNVMIQISEAVEAADSHSWVPWKEWLCGNWGCPKISLLYTPGEMSRLVLSDLRILEQLLTRDMQVSEGRELFISDFIC